VQEVRDAASAQVDLLAEKLEERKSILQVMADGVWCMVYGVWRMVDGDDLSNPSIYILLYACLENWYGFPSFS
jgi:hypothetical protein